MKLKREPIAYWTFQGYINGSCRVASLTTRVVHMPNLVISLPRDILDLEIESQIISMQFWLRIKSHEAGKGDNVTESLLPV